MPKDHIYAALCDSRLARSHCTVLACLQHYAKGDTCRPSRVRIAKDTGLHTITVSGCLAKLEGARYIEVTRLNGSATNVYRLLVPSRGNQLATRKQTVTGSQAPTMEGVTKRLPNKKKLLEASASVELVSRAEDHMPSPSALQMAANGSAHVGNLSAAKAERARQVTADAIAAFNASLAQPIGLLPAVRPGVGTEARIKQVRRCIRVAREICADQFGAATITPEFWAAYFAECARDPFKSGQQSPGKGHENWTPTFEYLTREAVMLAVFDKATSEAAA